MHVRRQQINLPQVYSRSQEIQKKRANFGSLVLTNYINMIVT